MEEESKKDYTEAAHYLALISSVSLVVLGIMGLFDWEILWLGWDDGWLIQIIGIVGGVYIALLESDSEYLQLKYKWMFGIRKNRAILYIVLGVVTIKAALAPILLIAAGILYILD